MDKKTFILKNERILSRLYRLIGHNKVSVKQGNTLKLNNAFMKRCLIKIEGVGNIVQVEPGLTRLTHCNITILGSHCKIKIGSKSNLNYCNLHMEDENGSIIINKHVTTTGRTELAVIEGKSIIIGEDCLFSSDISFRVGDSHSILDKNSGKRINPSKDITIGQHVWIGHSVKVLKGTIVGDNSIIGTGSVVTGKEFPSNSIIGGVPARVIKEDIDWCPQRIEIIQ